MSKSRVLFCTAAGGFYGLGHLKRCLSIIERGKELFEGRILLTRGSSARGAGAAGSRERDALSALCPSDPGLIGCWDDVDSFDLIVSDQRDTTKKELFSLTERAPVIALDDLGAGRFHAHCTVYALPTVEKIGGNLSGLQYLVLDQELQSVTGDREAFGYGDVVVSFGGSDPHGLTGRVVTALNHLDLRPLVVRGPFFTHPEPTGDFELVESPRSMAETLSRAGVLITSFGMTLFEALALEVPVVLLNHTPYHERLAGTMPLVSSLGYHGDLREDALEEGLKRLLSERQKLQRDAKELAGLVDFRGADRTVSLIEKTLTGGRSDCLFHHGTYRALKRDETFTLMSCTTCRDLFLFELESLGNIYEQGHYFLSAYEKQYGRTYVQDRDHIRRIGSVRMDLIESCLRRAALRRTVFEKRRILDVGCALGFFLEIARERGWETVGVEVSGYAASWAREHGGVEVLCGSFLRVSLEPESFDALTLFFVAEHFKDVDKVIDRAHTLLRRGGVLSCALPNRGGISYRTNRRSFVENHPRDHYFDTAPRNMIRYLKSKGFQKWRIRVTGVHPERFYRILGLERDLPLLRSLYAVCARLMRLGDTFEYYGIKK
jgi:spore coat polysaccharide biosynthesis predicted glycosyltransferase SpsG/SAM-dependent methyltransferase